MLQMLPTFPFEATVFKQLKQVIYQLLKVMKQGFTDVEENNSLVVRLGVMRHSSQPRFPTDFICDLCKSFHYFMFLCICKNRKFSSLSWEFLGTSMSKMLGYFCNAKQWQLHTWALKLVIFHVKLYPPQADTCQSLELNSLEALSE